jgi:glutamyl-tRNA reductase
MDVLAVGCSFHTTPVEVREKLAFTEEQLARAFSCLHQAGYEAVILSTCNRVELYLARDASSPVDAAPLSLLAELHGLPPGEVEPHLYHHRGRDAVRHLFRVAASLDSMLIGEGQIAGQVKKAYEKALSAGAAGPMLNALLPHARRVARRVRTETGISQGHVSVSSAAVDYVREVFEQFGDKTVLVIGAGKMGELTLKHLMSLKPKRVLVTNRSPEKARAVSAACRGEAVAWEKLDDALARADIILSTTGAPEPIVTRERYARAAARRDGPAVILDIAVPRDFDPRIHDGEQAFLFNIDDLIKLKEATLARRRQHIAPAEAIVEQETARFLKDWARRRNGPVIDRLTRDVEEKRRQIAADLLGRLNGKLSEADKQDIEKALSLLTGRILHVPISVLAEESASGPRAGYTLIDAARKLFRLPE